MDILQQPCIVSHLPPNFPPEFVGIVNDYYLENSLDNENIYNTPCERVLNTFYATKLRYYSTLELYRVMCGVAPSPENAPKMFIDAEKAISTMQLQTEQCADWAVVRSFRNYLFSFMSLYDGYTGGSSFAEQWCACHPVSSYVVYAARIGSMVPHIEKCFCQLNLQKNYNLDFLIKKSQYQARFNSFSLLDASIHLANAQHPKPLLSWLQRLKQRIIRCVKPALSLIAIGSIVLETAAIVFIPQFFIVFSFPISVLAIDNLQNRPISFDPYQKVVFLCVFISLYILFIIPSSFICIPEFWKARKPVFQLHMECLPAYYRLWKDYTHTLGLLKGACQLPKDVLWERPANPSVVRC